MCSNDSASDPVPEPRWIARSMLSFGIEYERAFSIAFWSARFPAGSGPPSRAATMIARESFEKSFPRRASAAPFLCLIDDHLLCPDMTLLPHDAEEPLVHPRVVGQFRVKSREDESALADEHRLAVELRENLDLGTDLSNARRADEDSSERLVLVLEQQVCLEACDLAAVGVAVDLEVDGAEVRAVEDDHARAGSEDGAGEAAHRLVEAVEPHQAREGRRFAARDDEPVEVRELLRQPDFDHVRAEAPQHRRVLAEVSLHGENADLERPLHRRNAIAVRVLGRSGLPVSRIGLGLAALGRPGYINLGHAQDLGHTDVAAMERRAHEVLDAAFAGGIRYFDAARSYGKAEDFLGSWLERTGLSPDEVTVGSKWGYTYTAGWRGDAPALAAAHAAGIGVIVKEALANGRLTPRGDVPSLLEAAERRGVAPDALALAAVLAQPWVDVVLSGAATVETLRSNLGALELDLDHELPVPAEDPARYWAERAALAW